MDDVILLQLPECFTTFSSQHINKLCYSTFLFSVPKRKKTVTNDFTKESWQSILVIVIFNANMQFGIIS